VANWTFLTNHARVLLCIAHDPGVRLRDIAASLGITERSAYGIVTDLTEAGYVVKQKDGRRNRYQVQAHLPLPEPASQGPAIGEVLALLADTDAGAVSDTHRAPVGRQGARRSAGAAASEPLSGPKKADRPAADTEGAGMNATSAAHEAREPAAGLRPPGGGRSSTRSATRPRSWLTG
jgi:hypothetical protein